MISRRTTRLLSELVANTFRRAWGTRGRTEGWSPDAKAAYDFLFDNDYPAWFCNAADTSAKFSTSHTRTFQEFFMKIHTGESLVTATLNWSWDQREKLGQQLLENLIEDLLRHWDNQYSAYDRKDRRKEADELQRSVVLDGYELRGGKLIRSERDILDVKEESGVLQTLYSELQLQNNATAMHHLALSEEHYLATRWDDSISNSRKFLELVLQEVARSHNASTTGELDDDALSRPVRVRDYLEKVGLLERKEKDAIASVYGLLSETGSHPYMAQSEQARLLRQLALTLSQFVLLRLRGRNAA
jgi:hypothetical protein